DGHTWRIQPTPSPASGGALNSVSCTSRSACTAVGGTASGRVLAERWNGSTWTIQPTPNPAGATQSFLLGVSCTSPPACMAAGAYSTTSSESGPVRFLAERWNGKGWTILPTPNPPKAVQSFLNSVSCTSPTACTAIGEQHSADGIVHTLAERWNGTAWRIKPTPNPPPVQFASLARVSCTGPSACLAALKPAHPARTVARHRLAHPAHPQPARRREHPPGQRGLPGIFGLYRIWLR